VSVDLVKAREVGEACRSRGASSAAAFIFNMAAEIESLRESLAKEYEQGAVDMRRRAAAVVQGARESGETDHRGMLFGIRSLSVRSADDGDTEE
jgi:hypothetical protein